MINKEQLGIMIESLEELKELLSETRGGYLFTEQIELLEYLQKLNN
jgi:DNA-directed RNA polymerase subunit F